MPTFRVRTSDGSEQTLQANRVVADEFHTTFERRADGRWEVVLEVSTEDVSGVFKRINELDGRWVWMAERPKPATEVRRFA